MQGQAGTSRAKQGQSGDKQGKIKNLQRQTGRSRTRKGKEDLEKLFISTATERMKQVGKVKDNCENRYNSGYDTKYFAKLK